MSHSWGNNSNSSPGFVYFKPDNSDSWDFLPFNSSSKHTSPKNVNHFSPTYYSSPRSKGHFYNRFNSTNQRHLQSNRFRSFNSSGDSFDSIENFRYKNRHNRHLDKSYNQNRSFIGKRDLSAYLDPTCMNDPWEELENEKKVVKEENKNNCGSQSGSEDDTESEEKSTESPDEDT